ncbi:hypothetical protein ID866_3807 [Astraeus odoratus]|nr:hypothetical protein ID866_3807 [Astraeus odoratus]
MGSFCSKHDTHSGSQQVLGGGAQGQGYRSSADVRAAAAEAAERRLKQGQARGTHAANPKRGRLAAQLEASAKVAKTPATREEERLVHLLLVSDPATVTSLEPISRDAGIYDEFAHLGGIEGPNLRPQANGPPVPPRGGDTFI